MAVIAPRQVRLSSGRSIIIRSAAPDDAADIIAHRLHMSRTSEHGVTQPDEVETDPAKLRESLAALADRPYELFLLAVPEDAGAAPRVIGELDFQGFRQRVIAHHGRFGISVDESWRGHGVGTALIRALLDWATPHPTLEKITLGVYATNHAAIRLYHRMGFREEARREKFFKVGPGNYVDDVQMALWVKPPRD